MNLLRSRPASLFLSLIIAVVALSVLSALPQHAAPHAPSSELALQLDPAQSQVHWTLGSTLHTVHGTFAFKSGALHLDPATGKASGEIVLDARSGASGNGSRDKKMHKEVLESERFAEVIFRPDRVEGKLFQQGTSAVQIHGIFVLHGSEHELTVPVQAELAPDHWTASARFSVPFLDWGLKNPGNFLLKVDHSVDVELALKGTLQAPAAR
jgi:polyisoprenoid-binding protein YceI